MIIKIIKNNAIQSTTIYNYINRVDWGWLSSNPAAIDILVRNLNDVNWVALSRNPAVIDILKNNLDKVN